MRVAQQRLGKGTRRLRETAETGSGDPALLAAGELSCRAEEADGGSPLAPLLRLEQQEGDEKHCGSGRTPQRPLHPHTAPRVLSWAANACLGHHTEGKSLPYVCACISVCIHLIMFPKLYCTKSEQRPFYLVSIFIFVLLFDYVCTVCCVHVCVCVCVCVCLCMCTASLMS